MLTPNNAADGIFNDDRLEILRYAEDPASYLSCKTAKWLWRLEQGKMYVRVTQNKLSKSLLKKAHHLNIGSTKAQQLNIGSTKAQQGNE